MDWGVIAQSIFFMAIALLAVVVTIFVFSASLLGRAVEAYKRQKRTLIQQGRDYFARQVSLAEQRLKRFESSSERSSIKQDEDERAYEEAIEKKREFKNASKNIEKGLNVFRLSGGVVYPSCFFLSSIFFSSLAWGIAATDEPSFRIGGCDPTPVI